MQTALLLLLVAGSGLQNASQAKDGVKKGEAAPAFKLDYIREDKQFDLSAAITGAKPIVLVFGSYT